MAYSQKIRTKKPLSGTVSLAAAATTAAIDLQGGTLVGLYLPNLTSTTFTITSSPTELGTYQTLADALGTYTTAGNDITFTIGATSNKWFPLPPALTAGLVFIKLVFGSSETADITYIIRNID